MVDSGSTDRTVELARAHGATVLEFRWNGDFPKKRNWFLRNHELKSQWVLFLDADERITPEVIQELALVLKSTRNSGFWVCFENWFMGKPLRHGDVFRKLAMFRHEAGEYEQFPEDHWSNLDMEVHEHPVIEGSLGEIEARLQHQDYRGITHYIGKHNEYSSWEARRFVWLQSAGEDAWGRLTQRQRFKYRYLDRFWLGCVYFLASYVGKCGFLDGRAGLVFALMKLRYFRDIHLKIQEYRDRTGL